MQSLDALRQSRWSLEEFVEVINRHSAQSLSHETGRSNVQQEVNARLVRYYTGAGLLDRPDREGKKARYGFRHLLQMLVVRRLLREGLTAQAIRGVTRDRGNRELEAILVGGTRVTVEPANPALALLERIRGRAMAWSGSEPEPPAVLYRREEPGAPMIPPLPPGEVKSWRRVPLLDGLELHLRDDFEWPDHPQARARLTRALIEVLENLRNQERS